MTQNAGSAGSSSHLQTEEQVVETIPSELQPVSTGEAPTPRLPRFKQPPSRGETPCPPRPVVRHHATLPALQSLVSVIVIAIFIITFSVQPFRIPSESMEPTLLVGDFLLVHKEAMEKQGTSAPSLASVHSFPALLRDLFPSASIHRGDVIVFHYPVDPSMHLVKRVVGLPGDHLRLRGGRVYVEGRLLNEPYAVYRPSPPDNFRDNFPRLGSVDPEIDSRWWIQMHTLVDRGELTVPDDRYFVLGDNRNDSEDSRYWGLVPRANVVGEPLLIYFSLRNAGKEPISLGALARSAGTGSDPVARPAGPGDALVRFARWERTLKIVR